MLKFLPVLLVVSFYFLVPSGSEAQGLVTCSGTNCGSCELVEMGNVIILWLFGLVGMVFAVMMMIAGFGLITSRGNTSALEAAKSKFVNAVIGLLIMMSAWLLIDFMMKNLLVGGSLAAVSTGWGPWNQLQCTTQSVPTVSPVGQPGSTQPPVGNVPVTQVQTLVKNAANAAFGTMSTASHSPGGGTLACAWAVNKILNNAGIGSVNGDSVVSMKGVLDGGRGTAITQGAAVAGDLVLITGAQTQSSTNANHVGICMNTGCTIVYSNSSSKQKFSWRSGPTFAPSYTNANPIFYRIKI